MILHIPDPRVTYPEALVLAKQHITNPVTWNHSRESEVVMRGLARKLGQDADVWGTAGLLHDLDWDYTKNNDREHCAKIREILSETKVNPDFVEFLISHAYGSCCGGLEGKKRTTASQHALAAAETITGLIFACALVRPDKKLSSVEVKSVLKKMKTPSFASKVNRQIIQEIEQTGITVEEFLVIALQGMKEIAGELGI